MKEQLPPFDLDAEEAVLGSCLIDTEAIDEIPFLEPADFFSEQNQHVFQAMKEMHDVTDQITVASKLKNMGKLDEAGGAAYLSHLVAIVPTSLHVVHYAELVAQSSYNRRLICAAGQIEAIGNKNLKPAEASELVTNTLKSVNGIIDDNSIWTPDNLAGDAYKYYDDTKSMRYIPTGIKNIDADFRLTGYLPGEYVLWCARTGIGKTTLLLQQACHAAATIPALVFSLEMSKQQVMDKNVSRETGLDQQLIALKKYNEKQKESVLSAVEKLSELKLYIAEGNRTTESIRRIVARGIDAYGVGIVFIDYLNRIKGGHNRDEHIRISLISKELADMAKEYMIPFVVAHQLNRGIELRPEDKRIPTLADLREGGEEDADLIIAPIRVKGTDQVDMYCLKDRLRGKAGVKWETTWSRGKYL